MRHDLSGRGGSACSGHRQDFGPLLHHLLVPLRGDSHQLCLHPERGGRPGFRQRLGHGFGKWLEREW